MAQSSEKIPFLRVQVVDDNGSDDGREPQRRVVDDNGGEDGHTPLPRRKSDFTHEQWYWFSLSAVVLSCVSALLGALASSHWSAQGFDAACLDHTAKRSPLTKNLDITYQSVRFNGSLLKENVFREKGGPDSGVDEAWAELGINYHSIVVSGSDAKRVGLAPDQVKVNQKYGGGYPANVEGLHQLHCLNLVRQSLWYNYDFYHAKGEGAFTNGDYILQKHVSHCLDIVRQQLMCTVDIGVMGQVWFQPLGSRYPEAYVDFNTEHVCRNFEEIRHWAEIRQMPRQIPEDFLEPPKEGDSISHSIP
ncbi:tat pathway signal sequence [Teratosphaeria destructans]|uniref:Tat pathway signal sequence n=1 Tax=Teratosphaeria destructans TaxID=418781 RepID=A0A9W7SMU9_9PEZI|nr:tat pathway signal sequence [Teratosphaeria destructans]